MTELFDFYQAKCDSCDHQSEPCCSDLRVRFHDQLFLQTFHPLAAIDDIFLEPSRIRKPHEGAASNPRMLDSSDLVLVTEDLVCACGHINKRTTLTVICKLSYCDIAVTALILPFLAAITVQQQLHDLASLSFYGRLALLWATYATTLFCCVYGFDSWVQGKARRRLKLQYGELLERIGRKNLEAVCPCGRRVHDGLKWNSPATRCPKCKSGTYRVRRISGKNFSTEMEARRANRCAESSDE